MPPLAAGFVLIIAALVPMGRAADEFYVGTWKITSAVAGGVRSRAV